jgi:fatty-acyl-CoA synthase
MHGSAMRRVTIGALLEETVARQPEREALVYGTAGHRLTYSEFRAACDAAARGLIALGLARGEHLALWATNCPEWVVLQFASASIGVVLVTVNPAYRSQELAYVLRQSNAKGLALVERFRTSDYVAMLHEVCPEIAAAASGTPPAACPALREVVLIRGTASSGLRSWQAMLDAGRRVSDAELVARRRAVAPDDVVNIQYTSGTTGFPKGAQLTHVNLVNNALAVGERLRLGPDDRVCIPVPLYHCFGCVLGTLACAASGAAMVLPGEHFDAEQTLAVAAAERATALYGVPTMFIAMLEQPRFASFDLRSLRTGIMAGAPCPIEVMRQVVERMHATEMTIAYGQTEASPVITQTCPDDSIELRVATVGRPLPGVEVKIVDPGTGAALGPGAQGELCCRGYLVMKGYYEMPEATAAAIDTDGWLHTGDLAVMDERGYYRITGRIKDMIIRGGENVYPREIEEFLHTHPDVVEAQVFGVPDPRLGEVVVAWVRVREGATVTPEALRDFCRGRIAHYKVPGHVKVVRAYPMTVTGKAQKFRMRELAAGELELDAPAAPRSS